MTNPRSAYNAWTQIKKKVQAQADAVTTDGGAMSTPNKKRTKAATAGGEDEAESPTKKMKATPRKPKAEKENLNDDEESVGSVK
jgi:hypothetical protein